MTLEIYSQVDVAAAWRFEDEKTLQHLLLTLELLPAFEYSGTVLSDGDQIEMEVTGHFYVENYEEGIDSYIEIKTFCATKDTKILRPSGVDVVNFVFGGPDGFVSIKSIPVLKRDLVITEDQFDRFSKEKGLSDKLPRPKPETGPKERKNLIALIGVLTELYVVGQQPSTPLKLRGLKPPPAGRLWRAYLHLRQSCNTSKNSSSSSVVAHRLCENYFGFSNRSKNAHYSGFVRNSLSANRKREHSHARFVFQQEVFTQTRPIADIKTAVFLL